MDGITSYLTGDPVNSRVAKACAFSRVSNGPYTKHGYPVVVRATMHHCCICLSILLSTSQIADDKKPHPVKDAATKD